MKYVPPAVAGPLDVFIETYENFSVLAGFIFVLWQVVKSPLCLCVIYKFNHPSGAKILHLLETTKACGCNPAVTCFFL